MVPSDRRVEASADRRPAMIGWPRATAVATGLELRRWYRQPLAVVTAIALPVVVAVLVTAVLGDVPEVSTTWAVVDDDGGVGAQTFFDEALEHPSIVDVVAVRRLDLGAARQALDDGEVSAVVVLPHDLSASLARQEAPQVDVLAPDDPSVGTDLAWLVVDQFAVRAWAESVAVAQTGERIDEAWPLEVRLASATGRRLDAAVHYGPAIGMFFVLLSLGFGAQAHVLDRENGIAERLSSTTAPAWAVVLGRALAGVAVGALSLTITALVMGLVFDRSWGSPPAVAVLVVAVLVCYTGLAALLASRVRTVAQAQVATAAVALLLAVGSGSFTPPGSADRPSWARLLPTTQALDAFSELAVDGTGVVSIAPELVFLVMLGVALLLLTLVRAGRAAA